MPASRKLVKTEHAGIYQRGNRYVVVYRDGSGQQHKKAVGKNIRQAKAVQAALLTDVSRGEYRSASRETFAAYAARWLDTYRGRTANGIQAHTLADYQSYLERYAIPYFGRRRLAEITAHDVLAFAEAVEDGRVGGRPHKGSSVRAILAPLKALFATAYERDEIRSNPAAVRYVAKQTPSETQTEDIKALTAEQLATLLGRLPKPWRLFFRFLADTGVRIGEAVEVRWHDVELGSGKVEIRRQFYRGEVRPPKSRFGVRTIRLTPELAQALWTLRKGSEAADNSGLVFTAEQGGRVDGSNLMSRVLKPAAREADIGDWVGFHTFRHTCATTLFRSGWNAVQVQRWLGHHKPSFTLDTYVHLLEDDTPAVIDVSGGGNGVATSHDESSRNPTELVAVEMAI